MSGRLKVSTTVYLTPEQVEWLKRLHDKTRVPVAEYVREAIDMLKDKYDPGEVIEVKLGEEE